MAKENTISFEFRDVRRVVLRCNRCLSELTFVYRSDGLYQIPLSCPDCGCEWTRRGGNTDELSRHTQCVLDAFRYFKSNHDNEKWAVRLIIKDDD